MIVISFPSIIEEAHVTQSLDLCELWELWICNEMYKIIQFHQITRRYIYVHKLFVCDCKEIQF